MTSTLCAPAGTDPERVAALLAAGARPRDIRASWAGDDTPLVHGPLTAVPTPAGTHLVLPGDEHYPAGLLNLSDPPVLLWVRGNLDLLNRPALALSGTRKPTAYGQIVATTGVNAACAAGAVIASGGAIGVDALGHRLALDAGCGTLAYLGEGITGTGGAGLGDQIVAAGGALVSEVPPGTPTYGRALVARDRLIAAHGVAVLIAAGTDGSGTAHTAAAAIGVRRPVLVALPRAGHTPPDAELPVALSSVPEFDGTIRGLPVSAPVFARHAKTLVARARANVPAADWVATDRAELAALVTAAVTLQASSLEGPPPD